MKNKLIYLAVISLNLSVLCAAPSEINYHGVLTDQQGTPVNGVRAMQIKLYDAPTGGNMTYQQIIGNVTVADGIYSFKFGASGNGIASALNGNDHLALVVDSVEQPARTKILAVPYALNSLTATTANKSLTPNYNVLLEPPVSSATGSATETSGLPQTFNIYSRVAYIPPDVDGLTLKVDASWQSEVWDGSRRPYILDVVVKIGSVTVYSFTFNGIAWNLNNFSFTKSLNAKTLGISTGFSSVTIQATKRDYGTGNNAVKINTQYNGGTCDLWLIGGPST